MAGSVNKVILVGRLGQDPEIKYTAGGQALARFSLATDESYKDRNSGEQQRRTEWHNIVAWRRLAEICGEYLTKGKLVYIEGRLRTRKWEDREGNKRSTTEIEAREMQMLSPRGEGDRGSASAPEGAEATSISTPTSSPTAPEITDDDIPF